ncbi:MAG: DNA repair protein RecO [Hyphomonadaceae bacterium]|nr:DNA repair protein RecO [Hyphomonadaceae bacterium]
MSVEWTDDAIVLGARPYGETQALAEVFARTHGRSGAIVHGGASRRMKPVLQLGNVVRVTWKARTADQLGFFAPFDLVDPHAARLLDDQPALAALSSAADLVRAGTAERQAHAGLFDAFLVLLDALGANDIWPALYARFELGLLAELGYGLDLGVCALTGANDDLAYVSPRTGRAATRSAGEAYADRLLRLPPFIVDPSAPVESGDVADAFALAGWFLERRIFDRQGHGMPDSRRRLIETLGHRGRL